MLNNAVLMAILRYGVATAGGFITAKGWLDASTVAQIGGVILATVPAAIGALSSTDKAVIKRVNGIDGVAAVPRDTIYPNDRTARD